MVVVMVGAGEEWNGVGESGYDKILRVGYGRSWVWL